MLKVLSLLFSLAIISSVSFAIDDMILIKQGSVEVNFADIDGYSYTMPKKIRNDFFDNPQRIESSINTILTMKHILQYADTNDILDKQLIGKKISKYLIENKEQIEESQFTDMEFIQLKDFLLIKYSYMFMQVHVKTLVKDEDVAQLAAEEYMITKQNYSHEELRNINYINIKYSETTKEKQLQLAQKVQQQLRKNKLNLDKIALDYGSSNNVEFIKDIDDFYYNDKYEDFSNFVFKPTSVGLINDILDAKNRYIVAIITKISPKGYVPFSEVKDEIIAKLKGKSVTRKFGNLIAKLTKDPIEVNEQAIVSLRNRYLPKTAQR